MLHTAMASAPAPYAHAVTWIGGYFGLGVGLAMCARGWLIVEHELLLQQHE